MRELPILAKDSVALNIRSGKQTQHRVPMKKQPAYWIFHGNKPDAPWNVGDLLYVRECSALGITDDGTQCIVFRADRTARAILSECDYNCSWGEICGLGDEVTPWEGVKWKYRPNILVPKTCARTWVKVNRVWVERIQDISEEDCMKEGVDMIQWADLESIPDSEIGKASMPSIFSNSYRAGLIKLWNSIYGENAWKENKWVWACEFERVER